MEQEKSTAEMQHGLFMMRLASIPVVDSTWTQLSGYYNMAKEYNALLKFTMNTAESGAKKVISTAMPVLEKYQPQISKADSFACDQLDKLEEKYPVIKKTPQEIITDSKELCTNFVQPAVDKVNAVKQLGDSTISTVKHFSSIENSKEFGKKQMLRASDYTQSQLKWMLQTDYGQHLLHQVEIYLTYSEDVLDKYLPSVEGEDPDKEGPKDNMARVSCLSRKIKSRVYAKAMKDLQNAHVRSKEAVDKLITSFGLIEKMQNNLSSPREMLLNLQEKLTSTWKDITAEEDPLASKPVEERTTNDIAISIARRLTKQVQDTISTIYSSLPETPVIVKQLIEESQQYSERLYHSLLQTKSVQDIPSTLYTKTTESVIGLQQIFKTLMETPLSYIQRLPKSEEIEMAPINDTTAESSDKNAKKDSENDAKKDSENDAKKGSENDAKKGSENDAKKGTEKEAKKGAEKDTKVVVKDSKEETKHKSEKQSGKPTKRKDN